ncbi:MAG: hypothetical protein J6L91_04975, partial [Clostridia bacterium]|nr:hypothetical protein [Clostridia bacterium]
MVNWDDWRCYLLHRRDIVAMAVYSEFDNIYHFNYQLIGVIDGKEYQILSIRPLKFTHKNNMGEKCQSIINGRCVRHSRFLTGTVYSVYINPELQWPQITQAEIDEIFDDI